MTSAVKCPELSLSSVHRYVLFVIIIAVVFFVPSTFCQTDIDLLCASPNLVTADEDEGSRGHEDVRFQSQATGSQGRAPPSFQDLRRKWKKVKVFDVAKNGSVNLCHNVNVRKTIQVIK